MDTNPDGHLTRSLYCFIFLSSTVSRALWCSLTHPVLGKGACNPTKFDLEKIQHILPEFIFSTCFQKTIIQFTTKRYF